jgi:hypothetical protein
LAENGPAICSESDGREWRECDAKRSPESVHSLVHGPGVLAQRGPGALRARQSRRWTIDKDDFSDYIRALEAHDYAGFSKYYSDDFRFHPGGGRVLNRDETIAYERELAAMTDWTMDVRRVIADAGGIVMEAVMDIEYKNDPPPGVPNPIAKGTRVKSHFVAIYTLGDGLLSELHFFLPNDPEK